VVYEGLDPVTGKERRRWHPAGTTREEAERLAARLAAELNGRNDEVRSLTFGAYLTGPWLPGRRSTWLSRPGMDTGGRSTGTFSPPSAIFASGGGKPAADRPDHDGRGIRAQVGPWGPFASRQILQA
jgi:hypothetical protein